MNSSVLRPRSAKRWKAWFALLLVLPGPRLLVAQNTWQPAHGPLMTRWAKDVTPKRVHPEYPRPQMVRKDWQNLNGLWDYAITDKDAKAATQWQGKILVPFPVESALSGVMKTVGDKNRLWYRRTFTVPRGWKGKQVLLHFGAVDWEATVWVNGRELGTHRGGYDGFSFNLTGALNPSGDQELVLAVWDPSDAGPQPRGKQVRKTGGIWYTPTSGIWQTPWLEPVALAHIESLRIAPDVDAESVTVRGEIVGAATSVSFRVTVLDKGRKISEGELTTANVTGGTIRPTVTVRVPNPKFWSPDSPHLYDLKLTVRQGSKDPDEVQSYFGMRKIALGKDEKGTPRLFLNNKPLFQLGPLDQGFWPDGLYTAPTDEALRYDIEVLKQLGFNMARKHVKVEPERWYYWCDKLGLLVWQDMPSGDKSARWQGPSGFDGEEMKRTSESAAIYEKELKALMDGRYNHPCIVTWVPFNEGWGQFDTVRILNWVKQYDPSRLVDGASGGNHFPAGHILDHHQYPGPGTPKPVTDRAMVLGEFGGLGLPVRGHTWQGEKNWGYRSFTNAADLTTAYLGLIKKLRPLTGEPGLAAAIYTQTTDVEVEVNGLMTYDRALIKMDEKAVAAANRKVYLPPPPPPVVTTLSPASQEHGVEWRYTTEKPVDRWAAPDFDDSAWQTGPGGFGEPTTPGSVVRTKWKTSDIWIRRHFDLPARFKAHSLHLLIHHDEDAEVYVNGKRVASFERHSSAYDMVPLDGRINGALRPGGNTLAVHCHQTVGGQYIDAGIVEVVEQETTTMNKAAAPSPRPSPSGSGSAARRASAEQSALSSRESGRRFSHSPGGRAVMRGKPANEPSAQDPLYLGNRPPLQPSAFIKLPIGSITPRGWLRHQLELERDGMIGRLKEISPWLSFDKSAWANKEGKGERGWEEMPYWLKGYGDLGYVLKDERIIAETRRWIEAAMASQREDGWFGPRDLLKSLEGKPDLWPHMVMLNILQSYHEHTGDMRVLDVMTRYFKWENQLPPSAFGAGYWPKIRAGDNIESLYWLYNRTGEAWLLELAGRIHQNMARWDTGVINWHNVNISQGFREPAVFFIQSRNPAHLAQAEKNYQQVMGRYGQFAGGGFAGDENCRPGYDDPRQGFETCGMVEFMHSFEMLTKISGNPVWADRCEEIAFNSLPAALTPDWKGLHYLTCANQIQLDRNNKAPAVENGGTMFSYSPFEVYRCCQHNVSHGWPYYAEELWLATPDRGLCASLYAASEVTAKVGDGTTVKIVEETDYPFSDTVTLKISTPKPVAFPLYLRIPRWCEKPMVKVNGRNVSVKAKPLSNAVIGRTWKDGDIVSLHLPMRVSVRKWAKNHNAISVDYGPLTFSLKIAEKWTRYGRNEAWPEWEVFPTTPWNYGLELDAKNPGRSFEVVKKPGPLPANPFTLESAPIELRARARKIPQWQQDKFGLVGKLQDCPVKSDEPVETVSLVPMGAARLRITSFPVIGRGQDAREWTVANAPPLTASHCFANDSVEAMIDGKEPKSSNDSSIPRFTWWDHRGTTEWVEWGFPKPRRVSSVEVYWFDDTGKGGCRVPQSWKLLYRVGERWLRVEAAGEFGTKLDAYNRVTFKPVETEGLRIEAQLRPGFSGGILEWKVKE